MLICPIHSHCFNRQARVAVCERILNLCVDVEEGKVGRDRSIVEMFTLIMSSQQEPLSQQSAHLTAKLIQSLAIPGRKKKLGSKPQQISPGNNFLMLYLHILVDSTCASMTFSHGFGVLSLVGLL